MKVLKKDDFTSTKTFLKWSGYIFTASERTKKSLGLTERCDPAYLSLKLPDYAKEEGFAIAHAAKHKLIEILQSLPERHFSYLNKELITIREQSPLNDPYSFILPVALHFPLFLEDGCYSPENGMFKYEKIAKSNSQIFSRARGNRAFFDRTTLQLATFLSALLDSEEFNDELLSSIIPGFDRNSQSHQLSGVYSKRYVNIFNGLELFFQPELFLHSFNGTYFLGNSDNGHEFLDILEPLLSSFWVNRGLSWCNKIKQKRIKPARQEPIKASTSFIL